MLIQMKGRALRVRRSYGRFAIYGGQLPRRLAKIPRQRPTLPGGFACLNPAQRAAGKILTKYNVARWIEHDLGG